jgi:transcriptional regulator with XRE-family HTH domain
LDLQRGGNNRSKAALIARTSNRGWLNCCQKDVVGVLSVNRRTDLGDFLRSRRAALTPEETGVPRYGAARRVPGLRREEVALLAGMSVNYYTRLEQGENYNMSDAVVEALARALRMDEAERLHLLRLASPAQHARSGDGPEKVRDSLVALAESRDDQVAFVLGRYLDVLTANPLANAVFGLVPSEPTNLLRYLFLRPSARTFFVDWENRARGMAAYLRASTDGRMDDPQLATLVGELCSKSPDFVRLWSQHHVAECSHGVREYNHPLVGRLTLNDESLHVPDSPGQRINFMTAEPGSDTADRLRRLAV